MLKSMNFLSGKSRGIVSGGTKAMFPAPVILGRDAQSVPRILFQRVSNLVNKLALLLHKCWLREDSWDKPKNDWCCGRGFSAICQFFKYPSPEAYASPSPSRGEGSRLFRRYTPRNDAVTNGEGLHRLWCDKILGTRPRMTGGRGAGFVRLLRSARNDAVTNGEGMHRPWCDKILGTRPRMTGGRGAGFVRLLRCARNDVVNDTPHSALSRHSLPQGAREYGRSMIEMLGVLAIIAVLSVGGIAGYSKAMEKFKINKLINEYNMLIAGLVEHKSELPLVGDDPNGHYPLSDIILALNLVPETWKYINSEYLEDSFGNYIKPRSGVVSDMPQIVLDFNLGGLSLDADGNQISSAFSEKLCFELFNNMVYPLHSALVRAYLFRYGTNSSTVYYGDSFCGGTNKCISELTLNSIKEMCSSCDGSRRCNVTIAF